MWKTRKNISPKKNENRDLDKFNLLFSIKSDYLLSQISRNRVRKFNKFYEKTETKEKLMEQLKERYIKARKILFYKAYSKFLNPEQRRAVFTLDGPLLVLAGAGSGKTTVLVNRIAFIIKYGNAYFSDKTPDNLTEESVAELERAATLSPDEIFPILDTLAHNPCPPYQVLAITFTNKAANEIKERLAKTFDDKTLSDSIWAGTFHSVCLRILRKYGEFLGYRSGFSIYDQDDSKRLISLCMKELSIDEKRLSPRACQNEISRAKDRLEGPSDMTMPSDPRGKDIVKIYALYQKKLFENNAVDFDDIIMKTVELLRTNEEARLYYSSKFKYVLVDEYQDTNRAQFVLSCLLSEKYRNIMVVGDDDQSIYRFRGATVENILNFDKTYPDASVIKLEQNYRSTENILAAANAVIGNNDKRRAKKLWCDKGEGEKITLRELYDQNEEGKYIIDKITASVKRGDRKYSDFAILYRVNELARSLETVFAKSGVPYRILGSMRFYDRKEIKDIIAYLTVINSPSDALRLKRIVNEPKRKIGDATINAVEEIAAFEGKSLYEIMANANSYTALQKSADKLMEFISLIESIKAGSTLPTSLISEVFEKTGYRKSLEAEGFEGEGKIANVNELLSAAKEYEKRCEESETEPTLTGFLEEISLVSDIDKYDESSDSVVLMTIHSAKGLEFPVVFLSGAEDGIFPSLQSFYDEEEISEERRLAYVAITRAKEKLYITHTKNRMMYGKTNFNPLSRFVKEEIPENLIENERPARAPQRSFAEGVKKSFGYQPFETKKSYEPYREAPKSPFGADKRGSEKFGVEKLESGARVNHTVFGDGKIISARELGGDVLYEVAFDSGVTKKLMATFAKLKKI